MRTVAAGECIPFGLSQWKSPADDGWQLMLPVFAWRFSRYELTTDAERRGWWVLAILLKSQYQGFNFRWGWSLKKQTSPMQQAHV